MPCPSESLAVALSDTVPPEAIELGDALAVTLTVWAVPASVIDTFALPETHGEYHLQVAVTVSV